MSKKLSLPSIKRVYLVASGKGGVGKSTVSANLATGMAKKGYSVGLLDADFSGPSLPTMFGTIERPRVKNKLIQPVERYGVKLLSAGLLADPSKAFVWRGPLLRGVLKQLIRDTEWGELDILLIDLPPGTNDVHISVLNLIGITGAIVVTTPQNVAQADVRRGLSMLKSLSVPIVAIVENMSVHICPHCQALTKIFAGDNVSHLVREFDIKMYVTLPMISDISISGDSGKPVLAADDGSSVVSVELNKIIDQIMRTA